ncbi:adenylate kinase 8 [Mugil cephalus]|uniref:adenylate kinase 8 n=1 Tax=Mugil cephalus TaxID=48193 RepID=UPI001FB5B0B2|nr:adenylate kinase 8 [Mugil cephalus]
MDETVKPLRIPPEMSVYADKHHVSHLVQSLVSSLVMEQPDDPICFLISLLQRTSLDIPRVMLLGPAAVTRGTVAQRLSSELRAVHVTAETLLQDQSELSQHTEQGLGDELLVKLVQQRLKEIDCFNRGWVLDGIPQTRLQALTLQQLGVVPEHVVILVGGQQQQQHRELEGLSSAFQHVLKIISSDQPDADVYQQVLAFVRSRCYSRTPRILLLGPPGSGKSHQARLLSEKFKMVDVCCAQLLRSVAADASSLGEEIHPYLDTGRPVPDSLVLQVLEERLSRVDCSLRGWILHGFPGDLQQAKTLLESPHQPNRVFFLELSDDVCLERISQRATDPASGQSFSAVTRATLSSEVQTRLKTRPEDRPQSVTQRLNQYRIHVAALQSVFPDSVHVDANQDPHSVFETLESKLNSE